MTREFLGRVNSERSEESLLVRQSKKQRDSSSLAPRNDCRRYFATPATLVISNIFNNYFSLPS